LSSALVVFESTSAPPKGAEFDAEAIDQAAGPPMPTRCNDQTAVPEPDLDD
jgi:hypothetical protein